MTYKNCLFLQLFSGEKTLSQSKFIASLSQLVNNYRVNLVTRKLSFKDNIALKKNQIMKGISFLELSSLKIPTITHNFIIKNGYPSILVLEEALDLVRNNYQWYVKNRTYIQELLESNSIRKIIVPTDIVKRSLSLHYGVNVDDKIEVLYAMTNEDNTSEVLNFEQRKYNFCFASEDFITNGGIEVVKAFEMIFQKIPGLKLCVATNLDMASYYFGNLNKNPNIIWKHYNSIRYLDSLLKDSDVYMMPNLLGEFSINLIKAIECECIVVTTDCKVYRDLNKENENGFLLRSGIKFHDSLELSILSKAYQDKEYLFSLNKSSLISEIYSVMDRIISLEARKSEMMKNSRRIFEGEFSGKIWEIRMKQILLQSFPNLPLAEILQKKEYIGSLEDVVT